MFSLVPTYATNAAAPASSVQPVTLVSRGTVSFKAVSSAAKESLGNTPNTLKSQIGNSNLLEREIPKGADIMRMETVTPALIVPVVRSSKVTTDQASGFAGWKGLTHYEQRLANNGNQFSLEPPDQGLCAGAGFVVEAVNDVLTVFDTGGNVQKGVTDLNTFFGYAAAIDRTNTLFGPMVTDPKCLFDASTGRWFLSILTLDQDPKTGSFTGATHVDLAVSNSKDPTGDWSIYTLDTTDGDGSQAAHPGCPCLGDQPLIGYNRDAFFITTNEFSLAGSDFNGAQVYALSKRDLIKGNNVAGVHIDNLKLEEGPAYSLQPAVANSPEALSKLPTGSEYFLSALQFTGILDNRIALWALTGTDTLDSSKPNVSLQYTILTSEIYGMPPAATQKVGPIPLGVANSDPENSVSTNDDRMNQVQFAGGKLYAGLNTILSVDGKTRAGIAYFVVSPAVKNGAPVGKIASQGYVAVADSYVMYPSIAVAKDGRAAMTFSLTGKDYYPSAAYAVLGGRPDVHIAAAGTEPADGMTGYTALGGDGVERWGDYSAAVSDGSTVWMAAEYTPGGQRTTLANWGTFVFKLNP